MVAPLRLTLIAGLLAISACTTTYGSFCEIAPQLRPSQAQIDAMTDEEARKHLAYLQRGQRLCGWKP